MKTEKCDICGMIVNIEEQEMIVCEKGIACSVCGKDLIEGPSMGEVYLPPHDPSDPENLPF